MANFEIRSLNSLNETEAPTQERNDFNLWQLSCEMKPLEPTSKAMKVTSKSLSWMSETSGAYLLVLD